MKPVKSTLADETAFRRTNKRSRDMLQRYAIPSDLLRCQERQASVIILTPPRIDKQSTETTTAVIRVPPAPLT